ncbi:MAG: hypothetical protein KC449_12225 [Anaerolineales bacterium]|nr:hypothetical protein [Anaerolineales bacterium]
MTYPAPTQSVQQERQKIIALLNQLPADSLPMVETFIRFMQTQPPVAQATTKEPTPWLYPTVPVAAESVDRLIGIMPDVEGDALLDSEMAFDEV